MKSILGIFLSIFLATSAYAGSWILGQDGVGSGDQTLNGDLTVSGDVEQTKFDTVTQANQTEIFSFNIPSSSWTKSGCSGLTVRQTKDGNWGGYVEGSTLGTSGPDYDGADEFDFTNSAANTCVAYYTLPSPVNVSGNKYYRIAVRFYSQLDSFHYSHAEYVNWIRLQLEDGSGNYCEWRLYGDGGGGIVPSPHGNAGGSKQYVGSWFFAPFTKAMAKDQDSTADCSASLDYSNITKVRLRINHDTVPSGEHMSIYFDDLVAIPLPKYKVVTIMFDDNYIDTYQEAKNIMDIYDYDGVANVQTNIAGASIRNGDAGVLSADQIRALAESGWDISVHAEHALQDPDNFGKYVSGVGLNSYIYQMANMLPAKRFLERILTNPNGGLRFWTYVNGGPDDVNEITRVIASKHFVAGFGYNHRDNGSGVSVWNDKSPWYQTSNCAWNCSGTCSVSNDDELTDLENCLDGLDTNGGGWVALRFHRVDDSKSSVNTCTTDCASGTTISDEDFNTVMSYIQSKGWQVLTASQFYDNVLKAAKTQPFFTSAFDDQLVVIDSTDPVNPKLIDASYSMNPDEVNSIVPVDMASALADVTITLPKCNGSEPGFTNNATTRTAPVSVIARTASVTHNLYVAPRSGDSLNGSSSSLEIDTALGTAMGKSATFNCDNANGWWQIGAN